jgi:hypothetical protein
LNFWPQRPHRTGLEIALTLPAGQLRGFPPDLGFGADVADAPDEIIMWLLAVFYPHHSDGISLILGAKHKMISGEFDVSDGAGAIFGDRVEVGFRPPIRLERVVVAVDQEGRARQQTGVHAHALAPVHSEQHKTGPAGAIAFDLRPQFANEVPLELEDLLHFRAHQARFGGGDFAFDQHDIFKFIFAGGQDASPLVDFGGVEQVEHRKPLHLQNPVHALQAESTLAIEKIGDMRLPEAGFRSQAQTRQMAAVDALPESLA